MITLHCPSCGKKYKTDDKHAGRSITCTQCGFNITIPEADSDAQPIEISETAPPRQKPPRRRSRNQNLSEARQQTSREQNSKLLIAIGAGAMILLLSIVAAWHITSDKDPSPPSGDLQSSHSHAADTKEPTRTSQAQTSSTAPDQIDTTANTKPITQTPSTAIAQNKNSEPPEPKTSKQAPPELSTEASNKKEDDTFFQSLIADADETTPTHGGNETPVINPDGSIKTPFPLHAFTCRLENDTYLLQGQDRKRFVTFNPKTSTFGPSWSMITATQQLIALSGSHILTYLPDQDLWQSLDANTGKKIATHRPKLPGPTKCFTLHPNHKQYIIAVINKQEPGTNATRIHFGCWNLTSGIWQEWPISEKLQRYLTIRGAQDELEFHMGIDLAHFYIKRKKSKLCEASRDDNGIWTSADDMHLRRFKQGKEKKPNRDRVPDKRPNLGIIIPVENSGIYLGYDHRANLHIREKRPNGWSFTGPKLELDELDQLKSLIYRSQRRTADLLRADLHHKAFLQLSLSGQWLRQTPQDIIKLAEKHGHHFIDLLPTSLPPAINGESWTYTPSFIHTGSANPQLELLNKPQGMAISNKGTITWQVPAGQRSSITLDLSFRSGNAAGLKTYTIPVTKRANNGQLEPHVRIQGLGNRFQWLHLGGKVVSATTTNEHKTAIFGILDRRALAIIDLPSITETAAIPFDPKIDLHTAGSNRICIYRPATNSIDVYHLATGAKRASYPNPLGNEAKGLCMGHANSDELFLAGKRNEFALVDTNTGTIKPFTYETSGSRVFITDSMEWLADAHMNILTGRSRGDSLRGNNEMILTRRGKKFTVLSNHTARGRLYPISRSSLAGFGVIVSNSGESLKRLSEESSSSNNQQVARPIIGSTDLLLGDSYGRGDITRVDGKTLKVKEVWTTIPPEGEHDINIHPIPQMYVGDRYFLNDEIDRGYLIPKNHFGVAIWDNGQPPATSSNPALLTIELPTLHSIVPGSTVSIDLAAGLTSVPDMRLDKAPPGMKLNRSTLSWQAPKRFTEEIQAHIILSDGKKDLDTVIVRFVPALPRLDDPASWQTAGTAQVDIQDATHAHLASINTKQVVMTDGQWLAIADAKTLKPSAHRKFAANFIDVAARPGNIFALQESQLLILDGSLRTIHELPMPQDTHALKIVAHPHMEISYVSYMDNSAIEAHERYRIQLVDEVRGKLHPMTGCYGHHLAISGDGTMLQTSMHIQISDVEVLQTWMQRRTARPTGATIGLLSAYRIFANGTLVLRMARPHSNRSYRQLSLSPDGQQYTVDYVQKRGEGWRRVSVQRKDKRDWRQIIKEELHSVSYHPILPLVVGAGDKHLHIFRDHHGEHTQRVFNTVMQDIVRLHLDSHGRRVYLFGTHQTYGPIWSAEELPLHPNELSGLPTTEPPAQSIDATKIDTVCRHHSDPQAPSEPFRMVAKTKASKNLITGWSAQASRIDHDGKDIAKKFMNAVVLISHSKGLGSGFLIGKEHVLSCAHVLPLNTDETSSIRIDYKDATGTAQQRQAMVIARDDHNDLSLLRLTSPIDMEALTLAKATSLPKQGETVYAIGHPGVGNQVLTHTMKRGIISKADRDLLGRTYIQTDAAVNAGMSGGPLFDSKGNVIGVVVMKAHIEAVAFAVGMQRIEAFLTACTE